MLRKSIIVTWVICLTANASAPAKGAPLSARPAVLKPAKTTLQPYHRIDAVSVKFRDDLQIRADRGTLTDGNSGAFDSATRAALQRVSIGTWASPYSGSEPKLEQMRQTAQRNLARQVADLRTQFVLNLPAGADPAKVIDELNALDAVEIALPMPQPVAAPTPGDFQSFQGYLNAAPTGVSAVGMWTTPYDSNGFSVHIADIEYSWNFNHQDLPRPQVIGPAPIDPFNDNNHGTAVLGELSSVNNHWGTTGICYGSQPNYVVGANTSAGYDVGAAIIRATAALQPGDIILLEQQTPGPNYPNDGSQFGMVPVEWYLPWYNAIVTAVGNNITVVEAAGNGYQNLDDPVFSTGNGGHWPFLLQNDSGAIIVGAGGPPGGPWGDRARMPFSDYGATVDLQGWGAGVTTTGYGDGYSAEGPNLYYTRTFNGTSSASPIVAGACALLQDYYRHITSNQRPPMTPAQLKSHLVLTGSPQQDGQYPATQHIGPQPDVTAAAQTIDVTPPTPNPMMFINPPAAVGQNQIQMQSVFASDSQNGPVEYYFEADGGVGNHDSGWNSAPSFMDNGLMPNSLHLYRVKARDHAEPPNETSYSSNSSAATLIETPMGLFFGTVTDHSIQVNVLGTISNLMAGQSGLFFEMTPDVPGSGAGVWVQTNTLTVNNLAPGTTYTFRVKARNQDGIETAFSAQAGQTTSGGSANGSCDCNGDGVFELDLDTTCFTSVLLGTNPDPTAQSRCDLNNDGHVDGRDIAAYLQCALGGPQLPDPASNPIPADNATDISPPVTLQWTPGLNSTSSDIYFGSSQWAVDAAMPGGPEYMGNQSFSSFTPAGPLNSGTDYFWRIDSRSAVGTRKGMVWKFTTTVGQATNPFPFNGANNVDPNSWLTWMAAMGISQHDVYLGTNYSDVDNANTGSIGIYRGRQFSTSYSPGMLTGGTTYYWRIDEVPSSGQPGKGAIWSFTTSGTPLGLATNPIPWNFATGVPLWISLQWMAGSGAANHDVYLGTDWSSVSNATTMSPEFKGNQVATTYIPMTLMPVTTYYWRVDEVAFDFITRTHGDVWQFTTQP